MTQDTHEALTEHDVVQYLQQHPDFFKGHLELLAAMHVPHPSGTAISLISKQLELFRSKHHELENQLTALIDIARENDTSFTRLHQLTLALLEANTLEQVVVNLKTALADFFVTDFTAIRLIQEPISTTLLPDLFIASDDSHLNHFAQELRSGQPSCGIPTEAQAAFLFGESAAAVKSCALIPMVYPRLNALLAIGSRDEDGFHAGMGNIFLTQISEVVATRLVALLPESPEALVTIPSRL